jgi:hypothetical protein
VDFASAGDRGDEGRILATGEAAHFRKSKFERGRHIQAGHVAGSKDELADGVFLEGAFFQHVVADALIRGQQDPTFRAHEGQPGLISGSPVKMSEMALKADSQLG